MKIILTTALGIGTCGLAVLGVDALKNLSSPGAGVVLRSPADSLFSVTGLALLATRLLLFALAVLFLLSPSDFIPVVSRKNE